MRGRPWKVALVLSAGANTRLEDAAPPGGKAQVELGDGTTPWLRTRALLMEAGYIPILVELEANQSGLEDAVYVDHSHGPAWAVREAMHVLNIDWRGYQLLVWYGDTVLTEWTPPHTMNYAVCSPTPIGVGAGRGRGYERPWDWGRGSNTALIRKSISNHDSSLQCCVGIYQFRSPEKWMKAFDDVVPEFQDPATECYQGLEVGMVEVWNRYAELEAEIGAMMATQVIDVATWLDVGDLGSLADVRSLLEVPRVG